MTLRLSTGLRNKLGGITLNKVNNGSFDSAVTGWTASNANLTNEAGGQSGNCMRVAETGGAQPAQAYQDITVKTGHLYRFRGYFKLGSAAGGKFLIGKTTDPDYYWDSGALSDAAWAQKEKYFVAEGTTIRITCESTDPTIGEYCDFDTLELHSMARSIQDLFLNGEIKIYSGSQPSSADTAPSGTHLCTIKKNGTDGISFDDAVSGVLSKAAAETWQGDVIAAATAGWFRLQTEGDLGTTNTTDERIDGAIAAGSGGQMNFTSTAFAVGATQKILTFALTVPAS